jgi:adenylate kinase family enzyme
MTDRSPIGSRIQVVGMTCSGKSTLAGRIGRILSVSYTDIDAIYWLPGWTGRDDDDFHARLRALAEGESWAVSGNYLRHTSLHLWPRVETVIWLDLPLRVLLPRILVRSFRRWRSQELLWGTNRENFWSHFRLWDPTSLIHYAVFGRRRQDERIFAGMSDPACAHVRFIRLRSRGEIEAFTQDLERAVHG